MPKFIAKTLKLLVALFLCFYFQQLLAQTRPLEVGVAGLSHDHIYLLMDYYQKGKVKITGITETDPVLIEKFKKNYHFADSLFFKDIASMVKKRRPEVVMAFGANNQHLSVVEACAPLGVHVMVEKPLATTVEDAEKILKLAKGSGIEVLTDYETSWYSSNEQVYKQVKKGDIGPIRKMVAHDGHQGPKEIGCSAEFLEWLTDPVSNGAGALFDFGCYGANLMTWLMDGQQPISVEATTKQIKPGIYPKVDDDATVILQYPDATGIIEASWNWPFNIKDWEVYGKTGYLQAVDPDHIRSKTSKDNSYSLRQLDAGAATYPDYIAYVSSVVRGEIQPGADLSSLENNLIVVKILSAARQSAKEGKRIYLQ